MTAPHLEPTTDRSRALTSALLGPRAATPVNPGRTKAGETLILIRGPLAFAFTATDEFRSWRPRARLYGYGWTELEPSDVIARPPRRLFRKVAQEDVFEHLLHLRDATVKDVGADLIGVVGSNARVGHGVSWSHQYHPCVTLDPGVRLRGRFETQMLTSRVITL